ncbi:MAG: hypothetical protein KGZ81_09080 [Flavobacteriales bacterium]|nr:hypothetical protein [Flavobacteriales bacterium]
MKDFVFKTPSYLFHPIFMGLYATSYYFWITKEYYSYTQIGHTLLLVGNLTLVIPITIFFLLLYLKKADSLMLPNLNQRRIPLLLGLFLFWLLTYKLLQSGIYLELCMLYTASFCSLLLALIASWFKFKISLHAIGIQLFTTFVFLLQIHFGLTQWLFPIFALILSGLVGSSRLYLQAHNNSELAAGYVAGSIPNLLLAVYWV